MESIDTCDIKKCNYVLEQLFNTNYNIKFQSKDWLNIQGIIWKCDEDEYLNKKYDWYNDGDITFSTHSWDENVYTFNYNEKDDNFCLVYKSKLNNKNNKYEYKVSCNIGPMSKEEVMIFVKENL